MKLSTLANVKETKRLKFDLRKTNLKVIIFFYSSKFNRIQIIKKEKFIHCENKKRNRENEIRIDRGTDPLIKSSSKSICRRHWPIGGQCTVRLHQCQ